MKKMDRRTFLKYSLGVGSGVILLTTDSMGVSEAQEKKTTEREGKVQKLTFRVLNRYDHIELSRTIATAFQGIGLEVGIEVLELGTWLSKTIGDHDMDMAALSWSGTTERIDPSAFLTEFYHSKYATKGRRNYQHYRNPEYDKVCDEANMEMDRKKRIALVRKCQEMLAKDYPIWPIGFVDFLNAYNSQEWEGPVGMMGAGIGTDFSLWTWLKVKPKTARKKIIGAQVFDMLSFSLGTRSGNDRSILRLMYDTFLRIDPKLNIVPWAASSWKIIDNKTVDITIRDGMKFHDGKPVTMEDVKFTFDYLKDKKMVMYKEIYDRIEKTEILANNGLRFHLTNPYGPFVDRTLADAHILPKHIWEKIDDPDKYPNEKPIGSGPFKFGYWKRGEELYLEANKEHFSPPNIEGFYRKVIPSLEASIAALENKEIDIQGDRLHTEYIKRLEKFPHLTLVSAPDHGIYEMRGDLDKKPFSDLQFRRAVSYLIPRKQYMDLVFGKVGHAASNTVIHPELKPWYNEKVAFDEYSPQKAREILKTAGYWWDKKGFLHYPK